VACSKTKAASPKPAAALYTSPLYRKSLLAALDSGKKTYILSAKHGLLSCSDIIEPYDVTLKTLPRTERLDWGRRVARQLESIVDRSTVASMFCGEEYLSPIRGFLEGRAVTVEAPLVGRSLGQRLQDLAIRNHEAELANDVGRFHRLMRALWLAQDGGRLLSTSSGRLTWPTRGVYFITEMPGGLTHGTMPRIVRVGTHAVSAGSRTTLWDRLSTHRGTESGLGSHRSSIFRSHVGRALMKRHQDIEPIESWGIGQSAPRTIRDGEAKLEMLVSETIGRLRVIWLDVPDDAGPQSDRAYFERNSIGLLSRANLLSPLRDREWLGRSSLDWRICVSGLWNLDHVFLKPDPDFLDRLSNQIVAILGARAIESVKSELTTAPKKQFDLFGRGA
jgi:hypothetical protein